MAAVAICAGWAQDTVSLVGISASRTGNAVAIELHTTGPADFHVERFTMGDWVSVWSNLLAPPGGVDEIPLELEQPELAGLVEGASLATESHHASIRFYLGPDADRTAVYLSSDGDVATLTIRERAEIAPLASDFSPVVATPEAEPLTTPSPAADRLAEYTPAEEMDPHPVPVVSDDELTGNTGDPIELAEPLTSTPIKPVTAEAPVDTTPAPTPLFEAESAEPEPTATDSTPVDLAPPAPRDTAAAPSSFYLPRESKPAPVRAASDPQTSLSDLPGYPQLASPSTEAEINYQYIPADMQGSGSGSGGGTTSEDEPESLSLEQMMEAATQMAAEMMNQENAPASTQTPATSPITTPTTGFRGQYDHRASLSPAAGMGAMREGKDALSDYQIDLFEIVGTPLDQAITLLVAPTDFNIIVDSSVGSNSVSLSFKDSQTNLKSALDLLTRAYGLEYTVQANTIVVAAKEQIEGNLVEYETRLFVLSYSDPMSIKAVLTATTLLKADQIEVYTGETKYEDVNDSTELAETTGRTNQESMLMESNLSSTPRNAILVKAVPEQMATIAEIIDRLDRKPKLIQLEVRVCEITETGRQELGLTVNRDALGDTSTSAGWLESSNDNSVIEAFTLGSMYRSALSFNLTLNHLIDEGQATILAQPQLTTVEGKQAIYFAGEQIPYVSERKIDPSTGQETLTVDFVDLGVTLNFKPRLDNEGKLTIDVNPIVSSLIEMMEVTDGVFAPRSQNRQLRTTVRVGNEEPFAMAGLISERETEVISKIPLLADLPLVGKLFRNRSKDADRTEIVVLVVPRITE
ncbi:hypothetical protein JW859_14725 [bacterium]|nr:hypothetical protein [bacterium]